MHQWSICHGLPWSLLSNCIRKLAQRRQVSHLEMVSSWNMDFPVNLGKSRILTAQLYLTLNPNILFQDYLRTFLPIIFKSNFTFLTKLYSRNYSIISTSTHFDTQGLILKCTEVTCFGSITLNPTVPTALAKNNSFSPSQVQNWLRMTQKVTKIA